MDWKEEKLWGILIVYLIIFSFIMAALLMIIKMKWILLHSFIPLLPIRTLWPSIFLSSLHILVIAIIIAFYMPLLKVDIAPIDHPTSEIEQYVNDSESRVTDFKGFPYIANFIGIQPRQIPDEIRDELGLSCQKPEVLNCELMKVTVISNSLFHNIITTCPTLIEYDEFKQLLESCSPVNTFDSIRKEILRTTRKRMELVEDVPETRYDEIVHANWDEIRKSFDFIKQSTQNKIWATERKSEVKIKFDALKTTNRVKMFYIPLFVLIVFSIYSIVMNTMYPNSPVPQLLSNIHAVLCFIIIFQIFCFSIDGMSVRNESIEEKRCIKYSAAPISQDNWKFFNHLQTCKGKVIRPLIQHDSVVEYMTQFVDAIMQFSFEKIENLKVNNAEDIIRNCEKLGEMMKNIKTTCASSAHVDILDSYENYSKNVIKFIKQLEELVKFGDDAKSRFRNYLERTSSQYHSGVQSYHNEFLEAIDRNDFDCEYERKIVDKIASIDCKPYDEFYENAVQCSLIVGSTFCVLFYMMAIRRTDFRQYSDDSRQIWIYKIDKGFSQLAKEFEEKVKMFTPQSVGFKNFDANESRNRYRNVLCMDHSRVILQGYNSYIHASWVKIPRIDLDPLTHTALDGTERQYIVTQAPLEETISEFYAMCWQQKVSQIVMLCEFDENGRQAVPYFPFKFEESTVYNNYKVTNTGTWKHPINSVTHTTLQLESLNEIYTEPRTLNHICIQNWPEKKVPEDPQFLLDLRDWINEKNGKSNPPIVIHSSAGTGRAATYVALDYLNSRTHEDEFSSASDLIKELRRMRWGAIESQEQFIYLIVCLVELVSRQGIVDHQLGLKYIEEYTNYKNDKESTQPMETEPVKEKTEVETTKN